MVIEIGRYIEAGVFYWKSFLSPQQADSMLRECGKLSKSDALKADVLAGKSLRRSFTAFGNAGISYSYNGLSYSVHPWPIGSNQPMCFLRSLRVISGART